MAGQKENLEGRFPRIGTRRPYAGRFGQHHGPAAARRPVVGARGVLADLQDRDRIVGQAHDRRGPQAIWGIPNHSRDADQHDKKGTLIHGTVREDHRNSADC